MNPLISSPPGAVSEVEAATIGREACLYLSTQRAEGLGGRWNPPLQQVGHGAAGAP